MSIRQILTSRRSLTIAVSMAGLLSLALGAHAALNKRAPELSRPDVVATGSIGEQANKTSRVALVIGNGHYPDENAPLLQPINDARALTTALRRDGFDVEVVEDASRDDMQRAVERLKAKIRPGSVAMLFFGGFGIQAGRESYMIPVDAAIWNERDVRRHGVSIESVLDAMKERGAKAKVAVIDASRRNPFERRFRTYSHGLAPINAPGNSLILTAATPGQVVGDTDAQNSRLVGELLGNLDAGGVSAETVFSRTRAAVSRASNGEQIPSVSSSLTDDLSFGRNARAASAQ